MKFIKIDLSRYHNEEWLRIIMKLIDLILLYKPENLKVEALFERLQTLCRQAEELMEVIRKSALSEDIREIDKQRSSIVRGFIGVVKNSQRQLREDKKKAARRLYIMLQQYRKHFIDCSYAEKSSTIHHLLQELRGAYASDVALMGFGDWVTDVAEIEQRFLDAYERRSRDNVDNPQRELRSIRLLVAPIYYAIIATSEATLIGDGLGGDVVVDPQELDAEPHDGENDGDPHLRGNINYNFAIDWNEYLKEFRNLLAQRKGRRAKKNKSGDGDTELPPETK